MKRKERFISLISIISILGIAIGVAALIIVIAVMTGFDKDLHSKIIGNYSHITIASFKGIDEAEYDSIIQKVAPNPKVTGMSPYVQGQVLIKTENAFFVVDLKGIEPYTAPQVIKLNDYMIMGSIDNLRDDSVVVGKELASFLGLGLNSNLEVYSPQGKLRNLKVSGIFYSGMYDYDLRMIFTDLKTTQDILGFDRKISAVALKLDNFYLADRVKNELSAVLGSDYSLRTWMEMNQSFFSALKLEKLTMFIILTLIILVASFNIISTLIVMVVEKTKDIGILKTIGMTANDIRKIFTYEGLLIGTTGIILGVLSGIALCALLKKYQFIKLPQDIYYIDRLPVYIEFWPDIVLIVLSAMFITLISTVYPASKAARLRPVEALRYE